MKIDPIINQVVSRCHVSDSNLSVIRYMVSRMKGKYKGWKKHGKELRKKGMTQAIYCHTQNKDLYYSVMSGKL